MNRTLNPRVKGGKRLLYECGCPCEGWDTEGVSVVVQQHFSRVQGSGFRVQGAGFRVQGSGFRVQGSGFTSPPRISRAPPRESSCLWDLSIE